MGNINIIRKVMNAIITAATGYTETDLQIFLDSVKRNCSQTKVFLIVFRQDCETINNLRVKYPFIEPIYIRKRSYRETRIFYWLTCYLRINKADYSSINSLLEFIGRNQLHIMNERFFIALKIVNSLSDSFSKILLTDSRDVLIQRDPFSLIDGKLVSGIEPVTIGDDRDYNSKWIKDIYGEDILYDMIDKKMVCSGVTLGSVGEVKKYLVEMCCEIWKHLQKYNLIFDQAIHNYLIHQNRILPNLVDNQSGLIATLCLENPSNIVANSRSGSILIHGTCPAIVHQYDRHPHLIDFIKNNGSEKFPMKDRTDANAFHQHSF